MARGSWKDRTGDRRRDVLRIVEEFIQHGAHMLAVASVEEDRVERILRIHLVSRANLNGQSEGVDGEDPMQDEREET